MFKAQNSAELCRGQRELDVPFCRDLLLSPKKSVIEKLLQFVVRNAALNWQTGKAGIMWPQGNSGEALGVTF